jgi:hypothetical protein
LIVLWVHNVINLGILGPKVRGTCVEPFEDVKATKREEGVVSLKPFHTSFKGKSAATISFSFYNWCEAIWGAKSVDNLLSPMPWQWYW